MPDEELFGFALAPSSKGKLYVTKTIENICFLSFDLFPCKLWMDVMGADCRQD
jgi:hypothetical protein